MFPLGKVKTLLKKKRKNLGGKANYHGAISVRREKDQTLSLKPLKGGPTETV